MRRTGASPDQIAQMERRRADSGLVLLPENLPVWHLWAAMSSQWRVSVGMGGALYSGLDYNALEFVMRMRRIPPDEQPDFFELLRVMEREAARILNERK